MKHRHLISSLVGALLCCSAATGPLAQSNAKPLAAMPVEEIVKQLKSTGRIAMSGAFFKSDSAKLTDASRAVLAKLAKSLKQLPDARVAVVGHTDSSGDFAHNVDLSAMRAQNVIEALVSDHSVRRARLVALGAGPIDPAASNLTPEGKAQNRRVAFVVIDQAKAGAMSDQPKTNFWLKDAVTGCAIWSAEQPETHERASWSGACDAGQGVVNLRSYRREEAVVETFKRRSLLFSIGSTLRCETGGVSFGKSNDVGR